MTYVYVVDADEFSDELIRNVFMCVWTEDVYIIATFTSDQFHLCCVRFVLCFLVVYFY